jgi:hypothetical protein
MRQGTDVVGIARAALVTGTPASAVAARLFIVTLDAVHTTAIAGPADLASFRLA